MVDQTQNYLCILAPLVHMYQAYEVCKYDFIKETSSLLQRLKCLGSLKMIFEHCNTMRNKISQVMALLVASNNKKSKSHNYNST